MISLLPRWLLPAVIAGVVLTNCATHNRLQSEQAAHATSRAAYAERVAAAEKARANQEASHRKTEQEMNDAQEKHGQEVAALSLAVAAADTRARAAAAGLRSATQAAASRARQVCAAPGAPELRAPADDPIGVLADVLGRADERAGALARIADDRGIAGRACEREFDAAREALKKN